MVHVGVFSFFLYKAFGGSFSLLSTTLVVDVLYALYQNEKVSCYSYFVEGFCMIGY